MSDKKAPAPQKAPAPRLGQKWNLNEFVKKKVEFATMIGTYGEADHDNQLHVPPPALSNLSLHFWHLDGHDDQTPHKEDEAYFVLEGTGSIAIEGKEYPLHPGDLIFVPRCADHRFVQLGPGGLSLLVIFSPNFTG